MGNELNGVSNYVSRSNGAVNTEPVVSWTSAGLKIYNIKKGDQIRVSDFVDSKYLFVNDRPVYRLDDSVRQSEKLIIYGADLTRGDIAVQGENGISTTVELRNPQNQRIDESFVIKNEQREERGLVDKIKDAPVKAYPVIGKGSAGFKISGTW